jgi:hypothetical protein
MTNTYYTHETENHFLFDISILLFSNCQKNKEHSVKANYLDFSKRDDQFTGGIK